MSRGRIASSLPIAFCGYWQQGDRRAGVIHTWRCRAMADAVAEANGTRGSIDLGPQTQFGAGEGIRTPDPNLGKVVLYP